MTIKKIFATMLLTTMAFVWSAAGQEATLRKNVRGGLHEDQGNATLFDNTIPADGMAHAYDAGITANKTMEVASVTPVDAEMVWDNPTSVTDTQMANFTGFITPEIVDDEGYFSQFSGKMKAGKGGGGKVDPNAPPVDLTWDFYGRLLNRPQVVITGPAETIDGNNSDKFTVKVIPERFTATKIEWIWEAPANSGNNPNVNFASPAAAETTVTNAHWFANPDSRLIADTGWDCTYSINCKVTVDGQVYTAPAAHPWKVFLPNPPAWATWPEVVGMPQVAQVNGVWTVTGIGTMRRTAPVIHSTITNASQFFNKIVTVHEGRHVWQWANLKPFSDLFDANGLYTQVLAGATAADRPTLLAGVAQVIQNYNQACSQAANNARNQAELDAFTQSNAVAPDYLEVQLPGE